MLATLLAVCAQLAVPAPAPDPTEASIAADATIETGGFVARIDTLGLLRDLPSGAVRTVDGPRVLLSGSASGSPVEWFGVAYDDGSQRVAASGAGALPDWDGRRPVEAVSFRSDERSATSVVRAGELRLRTDIRFDPAGPYLLVGVELTNTGTRTLRNLVYSREWLTAPEAGGTFPDGMPFVSAAPSGIARRLWLLDDLAPGASAGLGYSFALADAPVIAGARASTTTGAADGAVDVPLEWFKPASVPTGLKFGRTNGISFGDYDADGWPDVFACQSGRLWRNDAGQDYLPVADLDDGVLPPTARRYGASFGDYDEDGLPDIGTEPRDGFGGDECFHLAHNLGGGPNFADIATDPALLDLQPCGAYSETICWGDVDGDGLLDMFLPVYPPWAFGGPGNFFLYNLGPTGPGGAYRFTEQSAAYGLDNVPGSARPEGAQFVDVDFDGDIDLYSNGTLYRNVSAPGAPLFEPLTEAGSGILYSTKLEEGAVLFDHDLDGDFDLALVYTQASLGVRLFECRGDGSFFELDQSAIESPNIGLDLGLSAEDWDNDGDIDFTTRQVFRRNLFVETGSRQYKVATHTIPPDHIDSATPAWGDYDKDGDLDSALGNWLETGRLYVNTTYGPETPQAARRHVRVRVMRDSPSLDRGLETEYGTAVELVLHGDTSGHRWRKFTASSNGYLNQNEYVLHFALPPDPSPADTGEDWHFDVSVDFPTPGGPRRVDRSTNPLLADLNLAELGEREIVVYRSGRVVLEGGQPGELDGRPEPASTARLITSGGGLAQPPLDAALPEPQPAPSADSWVGLEFETGALEQRRVSEVALDGQLGAPVACGAQSPANLVLWDVTDGASPVRAGALAATTSDRNARSWILAGLALKPHARYRLVAHVTQQRATALAAPWEQDGLLVQGGLAFEDSDPCSGAAVVAASLDPASTALAIRVTGAPDTHWTRIDAALAGTLGVPRLEGTGTPAPQQQVRLQLSQVAPGSRAFLVAGVAPLAAPLLGGVLIPHPDVVLAWPLPDGTGTTTLAGRWPPDAPAGLTVWLQAWVPQGGGAWAASDALAATSPF